MLVHVNKAIPLRAKKASVGSGDTAPRIFNLNEKWLILLPLNPLQKTRHCPLATRLVGLPEPVSDDLENRKLFASVPARK